MRTHYLLFGVLSALLRAWECAAQPLSFTCQALLPNTTYIVDTSVNCSAPIVINNGAVLTFKDQNVTLVCPGIVIENGGKMLVGSETSPIRQGIVRILLFGGWQDECLPSPNGAYVGNFLSCPGPLCPAHASCGTQSPGGTGDCSFWAGPNCGGPYGVKAIAVGSGGSLEMHGGKGVPPLPLGLQDKGVEGAPTIADPGSWRSGLGWAILSSTIVSNTSTLQCLQTTPPVSAATGWAPGDQILLTTTDYEPGHNEQATLVDCSIALPSCTSGLCVQQALQYDHRGGRFSASNGVEVGSHASARVGLLSRNIIVAAIGDNATQPFYPANYTPDAATDPQSATSTTENYFGMQVIARAGASAFKLEGVQLYYGGQGGLIGRYAVHFHFVVDGAGMYVHGNAIVDSMTRAVVIHETKHVVVSENVAWKSIGHMFYLENGDEILNAFVRNMGVEAISSSCNTRYQPVDANPRKVPPIHRRYDCNKPCVFWSPNPYNIWIGNQAIGAHDGGSGYWIFNSLGMTGPTQGPLTNPLFSQHAPLREFSGNHASNSKFCFHSEGTSAVEIDSPYDCRQLPANGGGYGLNHLCIVNLRDPDNRTDPNIQSWDDKLPFSTPGNLEPYKEPTKLPASGGGNRFDWGLTLLEDMSCVRILSSQQFGVMWVRDWPSLVAGAVMVDNWGRGPTSVSGGSPLSGSGAFYNAFFMDVTAVGRSVFYPCTPRCCQRFDYQPGVFWPSGPVDLQTSAINFYDGPTHMVNIHVENYTDGLSNRFCNRQPASCGGDAQNAPICQAPSPNNIRPWWDKGPTTAFSWMLPNVEYYPVTFTTRNLSFTNVTNRHLALAPWSDLLQSLGNASPSALQYSQLEISNLLTVLQDDDGTLTGQLGSTGGPIISTTSTRFLRSPRWALECKSSSTCGVSPSEYINFFLTPQSDLSFWNVTGSQSNSFAYWNQFNPFPPASNTGKNVAVWRLSLRPEESSVPGLGMWAPGFINGDATAWGTTVSNITLALTFSPTPTPVKVWTFFLANAEKGDFINLLVPTTGSIQALFGSVAGDGSTYFYSDQQPQTIQGVNGMATVTVQVPLPRKTDECFLQGSPFDEPPPIGSNINICGTRATNPTGPCIYNATAGLPNVFYENARTSDLLQTVCDIGTEFLFEGMDQKIFPSDPMNPTNFLPIFHAVRLTGDFDPSFNLSRLPDFATLFDDALYARDFVPNTNDTECGKPVPQVQTPTPRGVCPVNWKDNQGAIGYDPQWDAYACNKWDFGAPPPAP